MRTATLILLLVFACIQFSQQAVTYDPDLAKLYLQYAKMAACPEAQIQDMSCIPCKQFTQIYDIEVFYNKSHKSQGFTAYDKEHGYFVIAFRGSKELQNWYDDLVFEQVDFPLCSGCKAHKGFYITYEDLSDDIYLALDKLSQKYGSFPLVITGHSLGGAVSALMAVDLSLRGYNIKDYYSFEAPRVFNVELARVFYKQLPNAIRITHHRDMVPTVPGQHFFGYYFHHHPTEVYYDKKKYSDYKTDFIVCSTSGDGFDESTECLNSVPLIELGWWDHSNMIVGEQTGCCGSNAFYSDFTLDQNNPDLLSCSTTDFLRGQMND